MRSSYRLKSASIGWLLPVAAAGLTCLAATAGAIEAPGPVTSDEQALAALDLDLPGLDKVKAAASAHDWTTLKRAYLAYRRTASPAKWRIMPADQPAAAVEQSDVEGDEICRHHLRNTYTFTPKSIDLPKDIDWTYNPNSPKDPTFSNEWTWCLMSRTEFWEKLADAYWKTRDEKYAAEWVAQLLSFTAKNRSDSPGGGSTGTSMLWRTLDSATRMDVSWPYAYYHFLNSPSFTPEAQWVYLRSMRDHALLLKSGLVDHPDRTGNWVTDECFGLYTIGTLFPEFREAAEWRQIAVDRLMREFNRMVLPDGFEAELTPGYHFGSTGQFAGTYLLAKLNGQPMPEAYTAKLTAMYRAPILVMDQSGHDVSTNDSWDVNAATETRRHGLQFAPDDPLLLWAATDGKQGTAPPATTMLPYAGFYAMRGGWKPDDLFLFFRGGPAGIGHIHEDMLEVVLRAWGQTLLFDPGTYAYDQSDLRRYTIGTASHNTIIVDGKWQHRGENKAITEPVRNPWATTPLFDYVSATYDAGYQQNVYSGQQYHPEKWMGDVDRSVAHTRRVLFLKPGYALVLDTLDGHGSHTFDAHFHLDAPAARIDPTSRAAFSERTDGVQLALYPLETEHLNAEVVQGQKEPLLGWYPIQHRAIPTVRFRKQQEAPAVFATFLYPYRGEAPAFSARSLGVTEEGVWARALHTAGEEVELAVAKDNAARELRWRSSLAGEVRARASVAVLRRAQGGNLRAGGKDVSDYADQRTAFSVSAPAALAWEEQEGGREIVFFNADSEARTVRFTAPYVVEANLPPGAWTKVTAGGATPLSTAPEWFPAAR